MSEGLLLAARFRLLNRLGRGGMGSVWRADDLTLGSQVAIKLIDPSIAKSPEAAARFKREAQSAASLRGINVVQILDYGVDKDVPFIAMELLEGESLAARLERVHTFTLRETAHILAQVANALSRAHQQGIVHRDLKPDNIFLARDGNVEITKVLDFGVAKRLGDLSKFSGVITNAGAMLGTPYYMSPEQALGQPNVDHRTDIWSFGIIAYECVTGVRPFEKDTLGALIMAICKDPLPFASERAPLPPEFDAWFACVAARDPDRRFSSLGNAMAALRIICGPASGRPPQLDNSP